MSRPGLSIVYGGPTGRMLNPELVERMGLDQKRIDALLASHVERLRLFEEMEAAPEHSLLRLAKQFDELEYHQQRLWGFPMDRNHHLWWSVPHCSCPNKTNSRLVGMPLRVLDVACRVHGRLLCDEPEDCTLCPDRMPVGDGQGQVLSWETIPEEQRVVNLDCPLHGSALVTFQPVAKHEERR